MTQLTNSQFRLDWTQHRGLFYKVRRSSDLQGFTDEFPLVRASENRASYTINLPLPSPAREFYQVEQSE